MVSTSIKLPYELNVTCPKCGSRVRYIEARFGEPQEFVSDGGYVMSCEPPILEVHILTPCGCRLLRPEWSIYVGRNELGKPYFRWIRAKEWPHSGS